MIAGYFHNGSGLGDQLFRYITVRTLAEQKEYQWGMVGNINFKGDFFTDFDHGKTPKGEFVEWNEKDIRDPQNNDIRSYDPEINFVQDDTVIDGSFEDSRYWGHNLENVSKWLQTEPLEVPDDTCIIGFRGGEYSAVSDLFLPKSYYFRGVDFMIREFGITKFEVHTDDPELARHFFPEFKVIDNTQISHSKHSNMGFNWRSVRNAKYAIVPNSAFFILPRLLKHHDTDAVTIAPRYWAGHNVGMWKRPACYYKEFIYIHATDPD